MQLNPYLIFDGQCEAAFDFYAHCLGGRIEALHRFGETPSCDQAPPGMADRIMHVRMAVDDWVLMGSDSPAEHYEKPQGFSVTLGIDDPAEAERVFDALAEGGTVRMPFQQTFWALRFGMLVDRFGIPWMVNCEGSE